MDRAVFMTPNYLADIFGAFSDAPHKYDLAWHIRGQAASDMAFKAVALPNRNLPPLEYLINTGTDSARKSW